MAQMEPEEAEVAIKPSGDKETHLLMNLLRKALPEGAQAVEAVEAGKPRPGVVEEVVRVVVLETVAQAG